MGKPTVFLCIKLFSTRHFKPCCSNTHAVGSCTTVTSLGRVTYSWQTYAGSPLFSTSTSKIALFIEPRTKGLALKSRVISFNCCFLLYKTYKFVNDAFTFKSVSQILSSPQPCAKCIFISCILFSSGLLIGQLLQNTEGKIKKIFLECKIA